MTDVQGHRPYPLRKIDAALLVGGLGTRLRSTLPDLPKALASIAGRSVLDRILDFLADEGITRVVLCLGHKADHILDHFQHNPRHDLELVPSIEPRPLGTAGALRYARHLLQSDPVLVLNGDTLIDGDLAFLLETHRRHAADATLLCTQVTDASHFGTVEIDDADRIVSFREKAATPKAPGWINAGLYLFSAAWLDMLSGTEGPSLERDVFQRSPSRALRACRMKEVAFIDIGTPESLLRAQKIQRRRHHHDAPGR